MGCNRMNLPPDPHEGEKQNLSLAIAMIDRHEGLSLREFRS
jgi:hypothetical protein